MMANFLRIWFYIRLIIFNYLLLLLSNARGKEPLAAENRNIIMKREKVQTKWNGLCGKGLDSQDYEASGKR